MNPCRLLWRPGSSRGAAACKLGMPLQERTHDQTDQLLIGESFETGKEAQVGMFWIESRKRIDLKEKWPS
jgi:hypothetical protein